MKLIRIEDIEQLPTVDAEPVRHGHWIEDRYAYYRCSECGWEWDEAESFSQYCPGCGALMDEQRTSDTERKAVSRHHTWHDEPQEESTELHAKAVDAVKKLFVNNDFLEFRSN